MQVLVPFLMEFYCSSVNSLSIRQRSRIVKNKLLKEPVINSCVLGRIGREVSDVQLSGMCELHLPKKVTANPSSTHAQDPKKK